MSQDWQWYAAQLHGRAMLRFQEGWAARCRSKMAMKKSLLCGLYQLRSFRAY